MLINRSLCKVLFISSQCRVGPLAGCVGRELTPRNLRSTSLEAIGAPYVGDGVVEDLWPLLMPVSSMILPHSRSQAA